MHITYEYKGYTKSLLKLPLPGTFVYVTNKDTRKKGSLLVLASVAVSFEKVLEIALLAEVSLVYILKDFAFAVI